MLTNSERVIPLAADLILIAAAFQIFDGFQAVGAGALRGAGMTRWPMVANLISYWVIGFPVSIGLAFGMDMGPHGLWWGLTAGLGTAAVLLTVRFLIVIRRPIAALDAA